MTWWVTLLADDMTCCCRKMAPGTQWAGASPETHNQITRKVAISDALPLLAAHYANHSRLYLPALKACDAPTYQISAKSGNECMAEILMIQQIFLAHFSGCPHETTVIRDGGLNYTNYRQDTDWSSMLFQIQDKLLCFETRATQLRWKLKPKFALFTLPHKK